jgi:hypothetical protein
MFWQNMPNYKTSLFLHNEARSSKVDFQKSHQEGVLQKDGNLLLFTNTAIIV